MTVTYQRPIPTQSIDDRVLSEAIHEGPAYARTREAGRWHRVRSAVRRLTPWDPDNLHETYTYWCGPFAQGARALLTDEPPAGEPRCGTCEGRAAGAARERDWIFEPSTANVPARCPGSRSDTLYAEVGTQGRVFSCLVCGEHVGGRYAGGPYSGRWGLVSHVPGPDLVPPCDLHGWLRLVKVDGAVVCRCQTDLPSLWGGLS